MTILSGYTLITPVSVGMHLAGLAVQRGARLLTAASANDEEGEDEIPGMYCKVRTSPRHCLFHQWIALKITCAAQHTAWLHKTLKFHTQISQCALIDIEPML